MSGMFFSGFLFISTHILLDLLSLGSAKAYIGWGGKLNGHLMSGCVRNIRTKNYQNLLIGFQVKAKNVGDVFFGTQCISELWLFIFVSYMNVVWCHRNVTCLTYYVAKSALRLCVIQSLLRVESHTNEKILLNTSRSVFSPLLSGSELCQRSNMIASWRLICYFSFSLPVNFWGVTLG